MPLPYKLPHDEDSLRAHMQAWRGGEHEWWSVFARDAEATLAMLIADAASVNRLLAAIEKGEVCHGPASS